MSTRSGRSSIWSPPLPSAWPEVTSRITSCDPCVNGFEALCDCGCRKPLDALMRASTKTEAQASIVQQSGHGFGELVFVAGGHEKPVFPVHDHVDYPAGCRCDHRAATGHRLQHGRRTGIETNRWKHGTKATAECCHNVIVWPLSAYLSTVGKARRRVPHA